ncbi:MAG: hypothetical protein JXQ23_01225, partial [Clostridia bacterium]|nr:hypothetical protein [Clostridia bacterium]
SIMKKSIFFICLIMILMLCSCTADVPENVSSTPLTSNENIDVMSPEPATPSATPEPTVPGWYLTGWEYFISQSDITLVGGIALGKGLSDYSEGIGKKNNFTVNYSRKDSNGGEIASGTSTTTWTDPADFLAPGEKVTITVNRETPSTWGIGPCYASIDNEDMTPGYSTSSSIGFETADGTSLLVNYSGEYSSIKEMPADNSNYTKRAIIINLGNSYGFRYNYEWRD